MTKLSDFILLLLNQFAGGPGPRENNLMRFGLPAGVQLFIEIFSFTFFIFMVGRIGKNELVATNVAFSMDTLGFLPVVGLSIGVSTLVGQAIGKNQPKDGGRVVASALQISMTYMGSVALLFILAPHWLIELFHTADISPVEFEQLSRH